MSRAAEIDSSLPARIYINGRFLQQHVTGVQRYGRELLKAWDELIEAGEIDRRAVEFHILAPRGPIAAPELRHLSLRQVGHLRGHLWDQLELPFHARDGVLFSPGNVHPLVSPALGPGVVTVHDLSYRLRPNSYTIPFRIAYGVLVPAALRRADAIITASEAEKTNIVARFPMARDRIHVVYHGSPDAELPAEDQPNRTSTSPDLKLDSPKAAEPFALWVGTLSARKNPQGAIDAIALLNKEMKLPLVMVGATYKGFKSAYLRTDGYGEVVRFASDVDTPAKLRGLYRRAVCLLFPSFYEGFGLPPLEAMTNGCPVVTSDIPVLREVCGNAALYCDPKNPHDIANTIRMLVNDPELRNRLRRDGLRRASEFSWTKCAHNTLAVLTSIVARAPSHEVPSRKWSTI